MTRSLLAAAVSLCMLPLALRAAEPSPGPAPLKTRNVILVMSDGLRWQEVFTGADERLMVKDYGVEHPETLRAEFWRDTPEARRQALMPFVWSTVATGGQIYGNLFKHSDAHITNPAKVSYPGYSETFCGFPNEYIKENKRVSNPEVTVFEWLNGQQGFAAVDQSELSPRPTVAAFGAWDLFPCIFNTERCGFPVDDGVSPLSFGIISPGISATNTLRDEVPRPWGGASFDALLYRPALEWLKLNKPRLMFLGLGETDEWAHKGDYTNYLHAAHRADAYLHELWDTLQSMPEYKDCTSIVFTCDHGRGGDNAPGFTGGELKQWRDHGAKVIGAEQIWIMVMGPDTPPLGERADIPPVTQSQIAATIATLLGYDYNAAQPKAAPPIADALPGAH